jgi:hypothetical protein
MAHSPSKRGFTIGAHIPAAALNGNDDRATSNHGRAPQRYEKRVEHDQGVEPEHHLDRPVPEEFGRENHAAARGWCMNFCHGCGRHDAAGGEGLSRRL